MKNKPEKNKPGKEQKGKEENEPKKGGMTIPAGTEQETGLTRGETEKAHAPVKKIRKDADE